MHDKINANPIDLLGPPVDKENEITDDKKIDFYSTIDCSSDLESRDINRNHDWIGDARQYYSTTDLAETSFFIVFKQLESHYYNILTSSQEKPLRIIIMEIASTRKSYLIKAIRSRLHEIAGIESKSPVLTNNINRVVHDQFSNAIFVLTNWTKINLINTNMLKFLNISVAKILAVYQRGGTETKNADLDMVNSLDTELLLAKEIIQDILFEENQIPSLLPTAVFIIFDNYKEPTINNLEG
ncbi:33981_t:CDS:2, partial [Racocetra persica]